MEPKTQDFISRNFFSLEFTKSEHFARVFNSRILFTGTFPHDVRSCIHENIEIKSPKPSKLGKEICKLLIYWDFLNRPQYIS